MIMEWLRKAPTAVVVTVVVVCGVLGLGVLGAFVTLSVNGVDTTELRQWVQTIGITVILPLLGVNTLASVVGARSSSNAEDNSNGRLESRDKEIAELRATVQRLRGGSDR